CEKCHNPTNKFYNCSNLACRKLILLCQSCGSEINNEQCTHITETALLG
ncbi:MAG: hypothetical protein KGQ38_07835, partial [Actinomycetales bacterium]|nr:hypothetical protein [Actinomycetales bacterium]